ncbi:XRE family transcriptional regulator, partial [Clostridioides difficile]
MGINLKIFRIKKGLKQQELADRVGLSEENIETIYDYFSDSTDNGSNIRLKKLISQKENITIKNN